MNSQSTAVSTNSTGRGGPSGRGRGRSRRSPNIIENINQEELDDGISKNKPKPKPKPPMELAFQNDVVLLEIFRHSSPSDLKEFRLVNRQWNDTATSTLLIRKSLELKLRELKKQDRGSAGVTSTSHFSSPVTSEIESLGPLTDLCRLIESSVKFPTQSLTFECLNAEMHSQVRQVLQIFGNQVKELTLLHSCKFSTSFLWELLLDLVPNLESLIIRGSILMLRKKPLPIGRIQSLPHLKHLVFLPSEDKLNQDKRDSFYRIHMELFQQIVDAAVNLRSVYTFPLNFVGVLLDAGKLQLLKKVAFEPTSDVEQRPRLGWIVNAISVGIFQKLASMKPEIKTLKMRQNMEDQYGVLLEHKFQFESALTSILKSSRDSLLEFQIELRRSFSIQFPVLPNLKKLKISARSEQQGNCIAEAFTHNELFSIQRNFPHLQEVHLCLGSYMDVHVKRMFQGELTTWIAPTVKHLTLQGSMAYRGEEEIDSPYEGPQTLGKMFPNATSVAIKYEQSDYEFYVAPRQRPLTISPIIWHQIPADIRSLSVTGLDATDLDEDIVDTFFTGMPTQICRRLKKLPQRICGDKDGLDALRTAPSICFFKNLQELNISCVDLRSDHLFASHVTGLYAFDLMPQLKVTVTYKPEVEGSGNTTPSQDMNCSLKHIAPYITQVCRQNSYY